MATNTPLLPRQVVDLHCGICSNVFTNPLMMPCLHSFCKKCLEQQLEEQGSSAGSIKCPTCDTVSTLPSGGVASLPNNHWLAHQAEVSTYQQKIEDGGNVSCERCVKKTSGAAVAFCCNCCLFLCSSCQEDHQWWRETVSHELVSVGEKKADMDTKVDTSRKPVMCVKHSKKLKFYCDTCQCLICRDCRVLEHSDHDRAYPEDVAERERASLMETLKEAEDALAKLEAAITSREDMKKLIRIQTDEVNEKIAQEFKMIYVSLQAREKALHSKCEEFANQKLTVLSMETEEIENLKRSLTFSTQTASGVQTHSPAELLSTKKPIQENLQNRLAVFSQLGLEVCESNDISVVFDKTAIDEAVSKMGNVLVACDPAQCTVEEGLIIPVATVGRNRDVKVAIRDSNRELVCGKIPMTARVEAEKNGSLVPVDISFEDGVLHTLLSFQTTLVGEHKLTIEVKRKQIAGSPFKIWSRQKAIHENMSSSKQNFRVGSHATRGVAVHHNGDLFVSISIINSSYIQVFSSDGSKKLQIAHPGCRRIDNTGDGQLQNPFGLTILGEVLYVADSGNNRVQKFTLTGEYLGQFGNEGLRKLRLKDPRGICTDGRGRVLVADYGNNRVQIFTADGAFVSSISCGADSGPYDLAVDNSDNIHVTLYSSICIAVYSSDGKRLTTYGERDFDFESPTGIAIDAEGYRYVSSDGSTGYIFSPEGQFKCNFPVPGNSQCMTLDIHGNIYIASSRDYCVAKY